MKKLFFLICFWTVATGMAQDSYYLVEVNGYIGNAGGCGTIKGLKEIKLNFTNGGEKYLFIGTKENKSFRESFEIRDNKKIQSITIQSNRQTNNLWGCNNSDYINKTEIINGSTCFYKRNNSAFGPTDGWYEIKITPVLELGKVNTNATIRDDVAFKMGIPGNSVDLKYFNWLYTTDGGSNWKLLPSRFQKKDNFVISGQDFLKEEDYGNDVAFKIDTECRHCIPSFFGVKCHSNITTSDYFDTKKSAPYIIDNDNPVQPTCFGNEDGSITLTFSRALLPNESFGVRVLDKANGDTSLTLDSRFNKIQNFEPGNVLTITGLPKSEAGFRIEIFNPNLYTGDSRHKLTFNMGSPDVVSFTDPSFTNVSCHGGSDGTLSFSASGGNPSSGYQYQLYKNDETFKGLPLDDWTPFNKGSSHTRTGLSSGKYTVRVRDLKNCEALVLTDYDKDGNYEIAGELTKTITINQPVNPLKVKFLPVNTNRKTDSNDARGAGLSDGRIIAVISGGTGPYNLVWKKGTTVLNTITIEEFGSNRTNDYSIRATLNNIGVGTYSLSVTDANHKSSATFENKKSCEIINAKFSISEPPPLKITITETQSISCNNANTFNDPYSNGELTASASGGIPLGNFTNGGLQYYYTWKKKINGNWVVLANQTQDIATNLDSGTYAVNIEDANGVKLTNDVVFVLTQPPPIKIDFEVQDVYCRQGSDGWAKALVTGGTPPYTYLWHTGETTEQLSNLEAESYTITVWDANGCRGVEAVVIDEPSDFITIDYTAYTRPSSFGASDGSVVAQVQGGTADISGSYNYVWMNENGDLLNSQTSSKVIGGAASIFQVTLNNIPAGTYYLTIEDANYANASTKSNCTVVENKFTLYDPIEAIIDIVVPISCNDENDFFNPFSDGVLQVNVKGGLPFSSGQPYVYHWKKLDFSGNYVNLPEQTTKVASGLSSGSYALNVEDALGKVIGVYNSDLLIEATDEKFLFEAPNLIELTLKSTPVSCYGGNNGTATVSVSGGTGEYTFRWSHGRTTPTVANLTAGKYFVYVKDEKGCEKTGQITVASPDMLVLNTDDKKEPTCYGGDDGYITSSVNGGVPPYSYLWNTGETTSAINNLEAAIYNLKVVDANGCTVTKEIRLRNPLPDLITLGEDRKLCNGQSVTLNATYGDNQTVYSWTSDNGFSSNEPIVSLSEAGTYEAVIVTSSGCLGYDTIKITTSDTKIDAHFVVSSQAFTNQEVALINISNPLGDNVEWFFPPEAEVVAQSDEDALLMFENPGAYDIILRSYQGACYLDFMKSIIVGEKEEIPDIGDAIEPFIQEFILHPNPTNGNFKVDITLMEASSISLKIFSAATQSLVHERKETASNSFSLKYEVSLASGSYILLLETAKGSEIRKMLVEK